MIKFKRGMLLTATILFAVPAYSQIIYGGSITEQLERWEGKNADNIVDYILRLKPLTLDEKIKTSFFLVIRTEINGWDPVEYQITLHSEGFLSNDSPRTAESKLVLIFEHPVGKSIERQYEELLKAEPSISLEEAANKIEMKRDTVVVDSSFQYFDLVNEMYTLELPIIYARRIWLEGTWSQTYMEDIANEHYSILPFGADYKYTNWVRRLFMGMIDHFHAIYPYKNFPKK
ncbi:MAG: hypothetical protein WAO19_13230 [Candidatus Kryptoniota bacterium]